MTPSTSLRWMALLALFAGSAPTARLKDLVAGAPKPVLFQNDLNLSLAFFGDHKDSPSRLLEHAFGLADELAAGVLPSQRFGA